MGVCWCEKENNNNNKLKRKKSSTHKENLKHKKKSKNKFLNENCLIENHTNSTIIKNIGQIKGESIDISSNKNCIILILDHSSSINIQNCENCFFLLSPCSSSIQIYNCKKIDVISASSHVKLVNITNGNFFLYTCSPTDIESCKNICLGNFFIQYTELPEMFHKSNLNIWDNKWSQYKEYGKNENIFYDNEDNKNRIIEKFSELFNECYLNYDQYQFLPFTYGKSINLSDNLYKNVVIIFRSQDLCEEELLKQITPDELELRKVKFISSLVAQENKSIFVEINEKIKKYSKNGDLIDFLNSNNINYGILSKNSGTFNLTKCSQKGKGSSKLNEMDLTGTLRCESSRKFLLKGDLLFLWFIIDLLNLNAFKLYIQFLYEKETFGWIINEDLNYDEHDFQEYLFNLFLLK